MKLSHLYSNRPEIFTPVRFRSKLNVVVARIDHPKDTKKLGHNLGKTLLIDVIDFTLLKKIDKHHIFKKRSDIFEDFIFFMELEIPDGGFLTIRRSVEKHTKIAFKRHEEQYADFAYLEESGWDHWPESFQKAVSLLDSILAFAPIKPWSYRKGISYFLRTQKDYLDVFQLAKFGTGKHIDWKPYLARILGFDDRLLKKKYEADAKLEKCSSEQSKIENEISLKPKDYDKLRASQAARQASIDQKVEALDAFDFHHQEIELTRSLVDSVELEIAQNNNFLYNARYDLQQIEKSLGTSINFDLDDVKRVFEESQITFPGQLARDYNDLVNFNKKILTERQSILREKAEKLRQEISKLQKENEILAKRRQSILSVIGGTDSFRKFKNLQKELDEDRASLALLQEKIKRLKDLIVAQKKLRETKENVEALKVSIEETIRVSNQRYKAIQETFSQIIEKVLHRTASIYVDTNENAGNMEFHAEFIDSDDFQTDEDKGTSFRKLLCIAFDLSILINYANKRFFHFVYHDGALETLQEKLKLALLQVIRGICEKYNIQYIFSCLSEDIPTTEDVENLCPTEDEFVLKLHDGGKSGRLFKTKSF